MPPKERTGSERWKLVAKQTIIKNTLIDPHLFDAFILTFAYPVSVEGYSAKNQIKKATPGRSPLKTTQRRREIEGNHQEQNTASVFTTI